MQAQTVPKQVYFFLVVGLVAASQSGNLIRLGDAHPAAIAAWRLLLATLLLAPLAGRSLAAVAALTRRELGLLGLAGAALAAHLIAWIAAVQLTTVANAAMAFAINPVITATAAHFVFGERVTGKLAAAIACGVLGVALIGWSDLGLEADHVLGDGVALLCSLFFTVYFLAGKRLRERVPTAAYVTAVYGVAAAVSFAALLFLGLPLVDYTARTWVCFLSMAVVPTMIGHTSFNHALKYIGAGRISTATLSEPLLAGVVAYFAWGEEMTLAALGGYALISAAVVVLVLDRRK